VSATRAGRGLASSSRLGGVCRAVVQPPPKERAWQLETRLLVETARTSTQDAPHYWRSRWLRSGVKRQGWAAAGEGPRLRDGLN
jgi:hypothetical protein